MTRRSLLDWVLIALALVALGFASVLAIRPALLPPAVLEAVISLETAVDPDHALIAIAVVVGLFALWRSYFSGATDVQDSGPDGNDRNRVNELTAALTGSPTDSAEPRVVGAGATERVKRTVDALERGQRATMERDAVAEDLRESLRAVERANGYSSDEANERIRTGEWTDDTVAAVFLGDATAGTFSLGQRLRMWLFPGRTFEQRLERTLTALEEYTTEGTDA